MPAYTPHVLCQDHHVGAVWNTVTHGDGDAHVRLIASAGGAGMPQATSAWGVPAGEKGALRWGRRAGDVYQRCGQASRCAAYGLEGWADAAYPRPARPAPGHPGPLPCRGSGCEEGIAELWEVL